MLIAFTDPGKIIKNDKKAKPCPLKKIQEC